jgi:hypothetical protein
MVPEPLSSLLLAAAVVSSTGITCHLDAYKCHKPTSPDQSNPDEEALQVVLFVERRAEVHFLLSSLKRLCFSTEQVAR